MYKEKNTSNSECYTPSSEPLKIYVIITHQGLEMYEYRKQNKKNYVEDEGLQTPPSFKALRNIFLSWNQLTL
jgi:hypothetical protein